MKPAELTPEIVRKLCRGLGGTKDLAGDLEEACQRVLNGDPYADVLATMWAEEESATQSETCNLIDRIEDAEQELLGSMAQTYGGPDD